MGTRMKAFSTSLLVFLLFFLLQKPTSAVKKSYVVYLGEHSHNTEEEVSITDQQEAVTDLHYEFLGSVVGTKEMAKDAIFYSYTRHINGFAANLEEEEVLAISKFPEVISVFPNKGRKLHTTHVWDFLGLEERDGHNIPKDHSVWGKSNFGENIIIANLDTGVWPGSKSFNDEGMGAVPSRWKGSCQKGLNGEEIIRCNRKLIGAKYFNKGYEAAAGQVLNASFYSAIDYEGHGTHTLSTAGGSFVPNANVFGYGNGTAKGGSPNACVASYKVCYPPLDDEGQCFDADILAGIDAAIADGVDVLSLSFGGDPSNLFADPTAIGSFHAVKSGITVLCSAGNDGPDDPGTVTNIAPWIITVSASTLDREFPSYAVLGNGKRLKGQSFSTEILPKNIFYPLILSVDAKAANATEKNAATCDLGSLDPSKVKEKIVVCKKKKGFRDYAVLQAGAAGVIYNEFFTDNSIEPEPHPLPATHISYHDGQLLYSYINSTKFPVAQITQPKTKIGFIRAPVMADFSSTGPNKIIPELLKPDITAPGVSIIASYSGASDTSGVPFTTMSGTSMSCPVVAGVVGLIKSVHPDWSPAAIKSAILTTAIVKDNRGDHMLNASILENHPGSATPFNYGNGHIHPSKAMDPGLIYDITTRDYLDFLCALGYNSYQIKLFASLPYSCSSTPKKQTTDLNYPSITIPNLSSLSSTTVTRTVKNVGSSPANYTVGLFPPPGVSVEVNPTVLEFKRVGEEKSFQVSFVAAVGNKSVSGYSFGSMVWSNDGLHTVTSPLVVKL